MRLLCIRSFLWCHQILLSSWWWAEDLQRTDRKLWLSEEWEFWPELSGFQGFEWRMGGLHKKKKSHAHTHTYRHFLLGMLSLLRFFSFCNWDCAMSVYLESKKCWSKSTIESCDRNRELRRKQKGNSTDFFFNQNIYTRNPNAKMRILISHPIDHSELQLCIVGSVGKPPTVSDTRFPLIAPTAGSRKICLYGWSYTCWTKLLLGFNSALYRPFSQESVLDDWFILSATVQNIARFHHLIVPNVVCLKADNGFKSLENVQFAMQTSNGFWFLEHFLKLCIFFYKQKLAG